MLQKDSIYPKNLNLKKPTFTIKQHGEHSFTIKSNVDAKYVYLYKENKAQNEFKINTNYFDLKANEEKVISVTNKYFSTKEISTIKIKSFFDISTKE